MRAINVRDPLFLLALGALIAGTLLSPVPADRDVAMGAAQRLGTLMLFVFWLTGLVGWGVF